MNNTTVSSSRVRRYWTEKEDRILRHEVSIQVNERGSVKDWNVIASKLHGRTNKDCRKRWGKVGRDVNKGPWGKDEDDRLRAGVEKHGTCWTLVAEIVETRHADQCAKRWYHFVDPNISHEDWGRDEEIRLLDAVRTYGRSWKAISEKEFPHRSATDIKNRYVIMERRNKSEADSRFYGLKTGSHGSKTSTSSSASTRSSSSNSSTSSTSSTSRKHKHSTPSIRGNESPDREEIKSSISDELDRDMDDLLMIPPSISGPPSRKNTRTQQLGIPDQCMDHDHLMFDLETPTHFASLLLNSSQSSVPPPFDTSSSSLPLSSVGALPCLSLPGMNGSSAGSLAPNWDLFAEGMTFDPELNGSAEADPTLPRISAASAFVNTATSTTNARSQTEPDDYHRYTLILEDMKREKLQCIMNMLLESKYNVRMKVHSNSD